MERVHREARSAGRSCVLVLHTPYGGGNEALVRQWRRLLLQERETLFEGSSKSNGATYRPLREIVSRWALTLEDLGLMDGELTTLLSYVSGSLGLPTVGSFRDAGLQSEPAAPGQITFFEAVGRLLSRMSERFPGVLLVHDLHEADSTTRAALDYLLANVFTDPVEVFTPPGARGNAFRGTVVVTTSEADGVLESLREELDGRDNVHFISLRDVEEEQVRRFVNQDEVVRRFMKACGGSVEHLTDIIDALPSRIEDLYLKRVERLARPEKAVLEALAVLGRPVKPDLLLRAADTGGEGASLSDLADGRLIARKAQRGELLIDFPSTENRTLLYDSMPEERRRRLHGRIGTLLEERSRFGEPIELETIAHHFLHSNLDDRARRYALDAAEQLHISYAYQRAREILRLLLPRLGEHESERRDVLARLAELEAVLGQTSDALDVLSELEEFSSDVERPAVLRRAAQLHVSVGRYDDALDRVDAARELLSGREGDEAVTHRVELLAVEAEALMGRGDYDGALDAVDTALELSQEASRVETSLFQLHNTRGKIWLFRGRYDEASAAFETNQTRAHELGIPREEVRALFNQGIIALQDRRYEDAERIFEECIGFASEPTNLVTRSFLQMNLGVIYHKTLRYDEAVRAYLSSLASFKQNGDELHFAVTGMNLASLYETLGEATRARALLERSIKTTRERNVRDWRWRALFVLSNLELSQRRFEDASAALDEASSLLGETGSKAFEQRILIGRARAAHGLGNRALRDELTERFSFDEQTQEMKEVTADAKLYRGYFLLDDGSVDEAVEWIREALVTYERYELHERVWLARLYQGLALALVGDTQKATIALRSAADLIRHIALQVPEPMREQYLNYGERKRVFDALESLDMGQMPILDPTRRRTTLQQDLRAEPGYEAWRAKYASIVGEDDRLLQIFRMVDRISESDSTVLIQGESGTGKELIAEAIHEHSKRASGPFVKVNCAAFVETLLLSELFGHERGAFTGAMARKKGRFELADGGTLFLDEIGDISANTQVALLRVLQEGTFERVGGSETVQVDVRLICATNRNLEEMVRAGTFRLDLYYRLKGVVLELPPLAERREDIPPLVAHFCKQFAKAGGRTKRFSRDALGYLVRYSWPGNIRELENFVRSILLFVDGDHIDLANVRQFDDFFADGEFLDEVPDFILEYERSGRPPTPSMEVAAVPSATANATDALTASEMPEDQIAAWAIESGVGLGDLKRKLEVALIRKALLDAEGNITQAARLLDMKRPRLSQIVNGTPELASLKERLNA